MTQLVENNTIQDETPRQRCSGEFPLDARLDEWMKVQLAPGKISGAVAAYGSPLNLVSTDPMRRNIAQLDAVASDQGIDFRVYFARKSNKCLSFVDEAIRSDAGLDCASENEIQQCLDRGSDPSRMICTAAVKDQSLIALCIQRKICIAVDNRDELAVIIGVADQLQSQAIIALRLGGFVHEGAKLPTRFGFDVQRDLAITDQLSVSQLAVVGVHFHLDGYDASQRVSAIGQSLGWIARLRQAGHQVEFLDIGGGFPISYLESAEQWERFWNEHRSALLGKRPEITYRNHGLGLFAHDGKVVGNRNSYPYYQSPVRADWFAGILDTEVDGTSIADRIRSAGLQLRCEPGRSLMDGCGMTVASVEFCKQNAYGDWLVGLSMNRTQCRTTSDDFLVDPIVLSPDDKTDDSMTGYLVGAYCTESELLSLRKLHFPRGIARGDLVVFPNTAGYLMHFLESRSHQFPLAKNLVVHADATLSVDPIDAE